MTSRGAPASQPGPPRCPLGICDGSGFVLDEQTNTARDCGCRAARIARMRAARLEGRIPSRYRGVSFDRAPVPSLPEPIVTAVRRYTEDISDHLDAGRGLWLVGDVGTGKTTLAMLASKAAIDAGRSVAIYSLPRLLNVIRDEVRRESSLIALLDSLATVDLLHVDDLGAQRSTLWAIEQFYSIIDARYQANRAIVATTNLWPDELARQMAGQPPEDAPLAAPPGESAGFGSRTEPERAGGEVGARIVSRLIEICGDPLPLFGTDMRRELRPATSAPAAGP
jgi:DNA replication protein DnaC